MEKELTIQEKIKAILIQMAMDNTLPTDMNQLDASVFNEALRGVPVVNKEILEITCEALNERSRTLGNLSNTSITQTLRDVAKEEFKKTNNAWKEMELALVNIPNPNQKEFIKNKNN